MAERSSYTGRFAPSPTGPLHFGSLVSAAASYLDARHHNGRWLVRVEDIDPPREVPGTAAIILKQLESHGLEWDGGVLYQSQRSDAYRQLLNTLKSRELLYPCTCSRQQLVNGYHGPRCRNNAQDVPHAWRVCVDERGDIGFTDGLQGWYHQDIQALSGDFVLLRKDGLFAYQLAVTADDHYQGISHVIRGCDLLDSTPRQIFLQRLLGYTTPFYGHLPLAVDTAGNKLSKQNLAAPLENPNAPESLSAALRWLRLPLPEELSGAPCREQLQWAQQHWSYQPLRGLQRLQSQ